ncbi:Alanine--tRNA ligase [Buchnera aphidicola (Anoecia corni)]|uniref:Alanine--tRNA ligase n=1 Tax=Buchnera aphidicola (Anoecia corni) TaxID=2994477 RepID=A0AAT9IIF1_9GAMM
MNISSNTIRNIFLNFFLKKNHCIFPGSPLVSNNDPSLLFTNAGMNQFKDVFLGKKKSQHSRIVTVQQCLRTGGKHNDLNNVGFNSRHHTFFEMLGNFSFNGYFKEEAISYAWELLTSPNYFNLPKEKLWITTYAQDQQTYNIWKKKFNIPLDKLIKISDKKNEKYKSDNFWQMSSTGPCGPSTEIFFDKGSHLKGYPPGSNYNTGDRFIEIWNLVFIQFNRINKDHLIPLPNVLIDTGMGLERIVSIIQKVDSAYETDLFLFLIKKIIDMSKTSNFNNSSIRIIADHVRSSVFIISNGIVPSNERQGYVLRRILRRAIRHGNKIGIKDLFFYKLASFFIEKIKKNNILLSEKKDFIIQIIKKEEEQFFYVLEKGLFLLKEKFKHIKNNTLDGKSLFSMYDTYGFPIDLVTDICKENNFQIDLIQFNNLMDRQKNRARKNNNFFQTNNLKLKSKTSSLFQGYTDTKIKSEIKEIFINQKLKKKLRLGEQGIIILDKTTFYPESGGQIGDLGKIFLKNSVFLVKDTKKYGKAIGHIGQVIKGSFAINDMVDVQVDKKKRHSIQCNHTSTHLLHASLRLVIGKHVEQKGSLVEEKYLRFDFVNIEILDSEKISILERLINEKIRENICIKTKIVKFNNINKENVILLPNLKYSTNVRVLSIGDFSKELCGGTHVNYTGEIGTFKITNVSNVGAGISRIEAVTGNQAILDMQIKNNILKKIAGFLKTNVNNIEKKIIQLIKNNFELEKIHEENINKKIKKISRQLIKNVFIINNNKIIIEYIHINDHKVIKKIISIIYQVLNKGIIIIFYSVDGKMYFHVKVTKNILYIINAVDLTNKIAIDINGKGGGKKESASGFGDNVEDCSIFLKKIKDYVIKNIYKYCSFKNN